MAVHKVPQDVEADDKLVGPFSFKQLIFLLVAAFLGFIMVILARISIVLIVFPLPFFLVFLFFGVYRRKDQAVETYVAALLRFYFKPRKRIWDKDGILETVVITAPKKIEAIAIDNMNTMQVKNRLKALGEIMDTRGWSTKNATLQDGTMAMSLGQSDRLVAPTVTQEPTEVHDSDDIMNNIASPTAQKIYEQTADMNERAKKAAMQRMQTPAQSTATNTQAPTNSGSGLVIPDHIAKRNEDAKKAQTTNMQTQDEEAQPESSASVMTTDVPTDILELSRNNDRSIESIAKEADQILESGDTISLHGH